MTTPDTNLCHACGHTAIIKSTGDTTTTTGVTRYYCANCYTKVINSFTHRPKYNGRKKELCLKPITPR